MTHRFKAGDHIRVSDIAGSTWQDRHGIVVDVIVRYEDGPVQECAVNLDGDRRWFMARHLTQTVSPKLIRFFRSEVLDRWKLDPDKTALLNGDFDQLVEMLCDQCHFTIPRAQSEVEQFYDDFDRKTQQTPEMVAPPVAVFERSKGRRANSDRTESHSAA